MTQPLLLLSLGEPPQLLIALCPEHTGPVGQALAKTLGRITDGGFAVCALCLNSPADWYQPSEELGSA